MSVRVAPAAAEEARARLLELVPEGFEEVERAGEVELAAYTDGPGEKRITAAFGGARSEDVAEGWGERWRRFHQPVRLGSLWIGPPWRTAPREAVAVVIDPGRAFGTGAHATTRLCLELLEATPRGRLLDIGCGSGVLAIAAAKLGFGPVIALDSDPNAVEATHRNAERNDVAIDVLHTDALAGELPGAEVAVANIALAAVESILDRLDAELVVTSGYRAEDRLRSRRFESVERREDEGWAADLLARRTD